MRNAILRNYLKGQFFNRVSMQIFGQFVNRVEKIAGFGLNRVRISGSECPPPPIPDRRLSEVIHDVSRIYTASTASTASSLPL